MMYKMLATSLALAFAPLALAQYPNDSTKTSASTAASTTHTVVVGSNGTLTYAPNNLNATAGDKIVFFFNPKNHTVSQSTFGSPCTPFNVNETNGFDSGFIPTTVAQTSPNFTLTINSSTDPIWIHCRQTNATIPHCVAGMVMAINAPTTGNNTFAAFLAAAKNSNSTNSTSSSNGTTPSATNSSSTPTPTSGSDPIASSVNFGLTALIAIMGIIIVL